MKLPRLDLHQLQRDYPQFVLALNKQQTKVVAKAKSFSALLNKLQKKGINPQDCIYIGPLPKPGTIKA